MSTKWKALPELLAALRRGGQMSYFVRYSTRRAGHVCSAACEVKDLLECYEWIDHPLKAKSLETARVAASVFVARRQISGAQLVRTQTFAEEMEAEPEWREDVREPEHLPRCYEDETGSRDLPDTFWVCSSRCPVRRAR
jgi:hypothetical protein